MTATLQARSWPSRRIRGVGEAMVEFAPVVDNLCRRGFAGEVAMFADGERAGRRRR